MPRKKLAASKAVSRAKDAAEIDWTDLDGAESNPALPPRHQRNPTGTSNAIREKSKKARISSFRTQRERERRLALGGNTRSQKTLTQLNFVNLLRRNDHFELQYLSEAEGDGNASDGAEAKRGRKKRRNAPKSKAPMREQNDTLTQMSARLNQNRAGNAVDGDQVDMPKNGPRRNSTRRTRKRPVCELETIIEESEQGSGDDNNGQAKRARRGGGQHADSVKAADVVDLTAGDDTAAENTVGGTINGLCRTAIDAPKSMKPTIPVTPQKKFSKRVVPSSQSPESPEITLSSQDWALESPSRPRPPLKEISNSKPMGISGKPLASPEPEPKWQASDGEPKNTAQSSMQAKGTVMKQDPSTRLPPSTLATPSGSEQQRPQVTANELKRSLVVSESSDINRILDSSPPQSERVINDTEDESGDEGVDFDDAFSQLSDAEIQVSQQRRSQRGTVAGDTHTVSESSGIETRGSHVSLSDDHSHSTLGSELSILYCRRPMSYHFSTDDIPDLSSTALAELLATQGQVPRSQNTSVPAEDGDGHPLELVPESSPVVPGSDGENDANDADGPPSSPILLVESSQRLPSGCDADSKDQPHDQPPQPPPPPQQQQDEQEDGGRRRGLLTASQLLTESLMESIPAPPGWTSSQLSDLQEEEEISSAPQNNQ
ncbi:hypothetical protein VTO42DRAFT_3538 [Malbranchea cinnamomea]